MKKVILFGLLVLMHTSCSEFLEEVPMDRLTEVNFYTTLEEAVSAVSAIYVPLRDNLDDNYWTNIDILSDYWMGRGSTRPMSIYQGLDQTNINRTSATWGHLYRGVRNANIAIERIQEMETIIEEEKAPLIAEARFLRGYTYFNLVRLYGPVPLYLETVVEDMSRKPLDEVYTAIINDLKAGEIDLPDTPDQFGHPTKWSAKAMLAEVYLTTGDFLAAKNKAKEIIDANVYSLVEVSVADDFNKIFGPGANGTTEEVFYLKFSHEDGTTYPHKLLWDKDQYSPFGSYVTYGLTNNNFLLNWNSNDLRKQFNIFSQYINRYTGAVETLPTSTPILSCKYRDLAAPSNGNYANDATILRYADVLLTYSEAAVMADNAVTATAVEYLNKIKRRAYGYPSGSVSPVDYPATGWTVSSFRDVVIQERGYELFLEGKRWFDLKRLGPDKLKEICLLNKGFEVKDLHLLWPIPQQEINTNPDIDPEDQNPGY